MSYPRHQLARAHKRIVYSGGTITLNQTAITDLHASALDITLLAQAGDQIEYGFSARVTNAAVVTGFDVYTIVSSARVNPLGPGLSASLATLQGIPGWKAQTGFEVFLMGTFLSAPLQAGDLANGSATLRPAYAQSATTARSVNADGNTPLIVWAKNIGPADPN